MEINFIFTINLLIIFNELSLKQIYGKKKTFMKDEILTLNKNKHAIVIFIGLSKAFNTVDHKI